MSTAGQLIENQSGTVGVVRTSDGYGRDGRYLFKKQHVAMLRQYAEFSAQVRTALNIHRTFASLAQIDIVPADSQKKMDKGVEREIISLLDQRMTSGDEYCDVKEKYLEDYFVLGHGVSEIWLKRNNTPYNILSMDAAQIAFVQGWDGTDPNMPRYAQLNMQRQPVRWLMDKDVMLMMNTARSYDTLGLSHVEALDTAIRGCLAGDGQLLIDLQNPAPSGALNLGEGVGKQKAETVRQYIENARHRAFVVLAGTSKAEFVPFQARDLKWLDKQTWFVREVAAVFGLPMALFGFHEDNNRSTLDGLLEQASEGLIITLKTIKRIENSNIVKKFGAIEDHNCLIDYPILNRKDEMKQVEMTAIQLNNQACVSINEGRRSSGLDPLPYPAADQVLITIPGSLPVPLDMLEQKLADEEKAKQDAAKLQQQQAQQMNDQNAVDGEVIDEPPPAKKQLLLKAANKKKINISDSDRKRAREFWNAGLKGNAIAQAAFDAKAKS